MLPKRIYSSFLGYFKNIGCSNGDENCQVNAGHLLESGKCKDYDRFFKEIISSEACRREFGNVCILYLSQGMIQLDLERLEKDRTDSLVMRGSAFSYNVS